jgi:hypothetical protein
MHESGAAAEVRRRYASEELRSFGRSWSDEEIMSGFVGDLAKLVQG